MMYSPKEAIAKGWITLPEGVNYEEVVQPNAIDFTLDQLFDVSKTTFVLAKNFTSHRGVQNEIVAQPVTFGKGAGDFFELAPNMSYDAMSNFKVNLPAGVACTLIIRSSGNRNLLFLTSGLYDSGYNNRIGFVLHNNSGGKAFLEKGVRIGQIIFHESRAEGLYNGQYNSPLADTKHWLVDTGSSPQIATSNTAFATFTPEQIAAQEERETERRALVERLLSDSTLPGDVKVLDTTSAPTKVEVVSDESGVMIETDGDVTVTAVAMNFEFPTTETHGEKLEVDPAPKATKAPKKRVAKKVAPAKTEVKTDA